VRTVRPITEDEMIAVFLQCELGSPRFGAALLRQLERDGAECSIIESPDLYDPAQKVYRRRLLGKLRGFREERSLFRKFPTNVRWERVLLSEEEVLEVAYISYDYWVELSGGSRRPPDAAMRIRQGVEIFRQPNAAYWNAGEALKSDVQFRELILVTNDRKKLVVLEGHVRLTAFALEPDLRPKEPEVILGSSERMTDWPLY
jgi:hypothetical protein